MDVLRVSLIGVLILLGVAWLVYRWALARGHRLGAEQEAARREHEVAAEERYRPPIRMPPAGLGVHEHSPAEHEERRRNGVTRRAVPRRPLAAIDDSVIPAAHIDVIQELATLAGGSDGDEQARLRAHLQALAEPAVTLSLLVSDARRLAAGDYPAGERLLANLNRTAAAARFSNRLPEQGQPGWFAAPPQLAGHIARPELPRMPCLIRPSLAGQLAFAIALMRDTFALNQTLDVRPYMSAVDSLFDRLSAMEALHLAAQWAVRNPADGIAYFRQILASTQLAPIPPAVASQSPALHTHGERTAASDLVGHDGFAVPYPWPLPCRIEQWHWTERGLACYHALAALPRYVIDDIYNATKEVSRRGCMGDVIEIRGRHLGSRGRITLARGITAAIDDWSDTVIRFRLPERMTELRLCIDPEVEACVDFPETCRLAAPDTDHSFAFVRPLELIRFDLSGPAVLRTSDRAYRIEACTSAQLRAVVRHAELVTITDHAGSVVWDSRDGAARSIDTDEIPVSFDLDDLTMDHTYVLRARNLCGTQEQRLQVQAFATFHLSVPDRVRAGDVVDLVIRASCPAPAEGIDVTIVSSRPDSLGAPAGRTHIPAGERTVVAILHARGACADARISVSADGYDTAAIDVMAYDLPAITRIVPTGVLACRRFTLEVTGDCFDPTGTNTVEIVNRDEGGRSVTLEAVGSLPTDPGNRLHEARLAIDVEGLVPGRHEVRVTAHGLTGDWFGPLPVASVPAEIHRFDVNPTFIFPCADNLVRIAWSVARTRRFEIWAGRELVVDRSFASYSAWCTVQEGTETITLREAGSIELRAFPMDNGTPSVQREHIYEIGGLEQASSVGFLNDTEYPGWRSLTLTIWVVNITTGHVAREGLFEPGDWITIDLDDCNWYWIFGACHEWIADHNRRLRTRLSADDPTIAADYQFHKFTLVVLGRDGAGFRGFNIGPGDGIQLWGERPPGS